MPKPTELPRWATDLNDPGDIVEPSSGTKDEGWQDGASPPHSYMNWLQNLAYQWAVYLDELEDYALTWTAAHIFQKGIDVTNSTTNDTGVKATGNGTADGLWGVGGSSAGTGVFGQAGTGGNGVQGTGNGVGKGVVGNGGSTSGTGISGIGGAPNGTGVKGLGDGNADGVWGTGGDNSGTGVFGLGGAANGNGVQGTGTGTGDGVRGDGGSSAGSGGVFTGGTGGHGVEATGSVGGSGGVFTGGEDSNVYAVRAIKGSFGHAIEATGKIHLVDADESEPGVANEISSRTICKAWATIRLNQTPTPVILDSFNIIEVAVGATYLELTMSWGMGTGNTDYAVVVTCGGASTATLLPRVADEGINTETVANVAFWSIQDAAFMSAEDEDAENAVIHVVIFGRQ